jgi:hypothetical protein
MTSAQRRALLILAVAICVVTALLWLPSPRKGSAEGLRPLYPDLEPDAVSRVELRRDVWSQPAVLARTEAGWMLEAPVEARADEALVGRMLRSLATLEVREPLQVEDLEPYGFSESDPKVVVVLEDNAGGAYGLSIGGATVDGGAYVLVDGEVLTTPTAAGESVPVILDQLRDRRLWVRPVEESVGIRVVVSSELAWEAQRDAEGGWEVTIGAQAGVDGQEAADPAALLRYLEGLQVAAFVKSWDQMGTSRNEIQLLDAEGRLQSLKLFEGRLAIAPCCEQPIHPEGAIRESLTRYTGLELPG